MHTGTHTYAYNLVKVISNPCLVILAGWSPDAILALLLCIFWLQSLWTGSVNLWRPHLCHCNRMLQTIPLEINCTAFSSVHVEVQMGPLPGSDLGPRLLRLERGSSSSNSKVQPANFVWSWPRSIPKVLHLRSRKRQPWGWPWLSQLRIYCRSLQAEVSRPVWREAWRNLSRWEARPQSKQAAIIQEFRTEGENQGLGQ